MKIVKRKKPKTSTRNNIMKENKRSKITKIASGLTTTSITLILLSAFSKALTPLGATQRVKITPRQYWSGVQIHTTTQVAFMNTNNPTVLDIYDVLASDFQTTTTPLQTFTTAFDIRYIMPGPWAPTASTSPTQRSRLSTSRPILLRRPSALVSLSHSRIWTGWKEDHFSGAVDSPRFL